MLLILVVDDEPDVEVLFRHQFRRDLWATGSRWLQGPRRPVSRHHHAAREAQPNLRWRAHGSAATDRFLYEIRDMHQLRKDIRSLPPAKAEGS